MDPITITVLNQSSEEENLIQSMNRVVLDLYENDGKTPKIELIGNDKTIQREDVLVGFVGLSGRGKSQLLRCLTHNEAFKSGNRPTTYKAIGTLRIYNNHRYWMIDAPGDSQATEPEKIYYYKKWIHSNDDTTLNRRLKEEKGHKYEEVKLTTDAVTEYNNDLKQKLHLCVFVFDNRVDDLLKKYYDEQIIKHLGTRSRVVFARTKWDEAHIMTIEARKKREDDELKLLIETFDLDRNRVRIVFTTGLIDDEPDNDPDIIKIIREKGLNIESLKKMIDETMNDHWEHLQKEKEANKQGLPLRSSELKEGDHILYFPTLTTTTPYSILVASNQNDHIQVYARTAKFINNIRLDDSNGTEYHDFSFEDFRRFTFDKVGKEVPDDYAKDPPILMIRQLYKNSTQAEKDRTFAIEKKYPDFKTKICDINCDGLSKTLKRAKSVIRNTMGTDKVTFKAYSSADFVYVCKTGKQPPLDNIWASYNLSSLSELSGYSARALSYIAHLSVDGAAKSALRVLGKYPIVDVAVCAVNCYQDPHNKRHYIAKAVAGGVVSTAVCVAASAITGPFAPVVFFGGMIVGGEIASTIAGRIVKKKAPKNGRVIMVSEDKDE